MEAKVYNQTGKETGKISLPENVFGLSWDTKAEKLVDQVVKSMLSNERTPTAHTKTRGEVSGTGIKPWKQKGTGRARHGSRRSPIWVGGGIAHGPRNERDYSVKINKKMKTKALFVVLSKKFKDGEVLFLNEISLKAPKTKEAKEILNSIAKIDSKANVNRKKNAAFITTVGKNDNLSKSFRNFGNLEIGEVKDLNAVDLLRYRYCVVTEPEKAIATLAARLK